MTKNILGLDLGTNSIGWALVQSDFTKKEGKILGLGSRIIPMDQGIIGDFETGNSVSQTAERTKQRSARRLRERHLLRRQRLFRVLNILDFLPKHFSTQIDFESNFGQFFDNSEPKIAYEGKEFIFKASFEEMLTDFKKYQPVLTDKGKKVPHDWTLYYLRKKALTHKIQKEELAWIILNFNQKRGYYQLRDEIEENKPNELVEYYSLKVVDANTEEVKKGKDEIWYSFTLENGWVYRRSSKTPLTDWIGKTKDFIVTTSLNEDGTIKKDKEGNEKRSFRAPNENDWTLIKKRTEVDIQKSHKSIGCYIYDTLLQNPNQKIKGGLIRTIERDYYKNEFKTILSKQIEFHPELQNTDLLNDCIRELYKNNENHQNSLFGKNFLHLFMDDIIFYQRPLRSKKSLISNCTLESRKYKDKKGTPQTANLKACQKSHPLFQEFRIWKWIFDLKIFDRENERNVTQQFISSVKSFEDLFDFLNTKKEIKQDVLLKYFLENHGFKGKAASAEVKKYRWNYVEDKTYPCNETGVLISSRMEKVSNIPIAFLNESKVTELWHIIYSVTDKKDFEKTLKSYAVKNHLDEESFIAAFSKTPPFKPEYCSYSLKALKKLLPLMRCGKHWNWDAIDKNTQTRIENLVNGEVDLTLSERVREKTKELTELNHFQALQDWIAKYIVYGRHSEATDLKKWKSPDQIDIFLDDFRQHSLRNPIVEQIVLETLRVVRDIWVHFGKGQENFFNEIHIELGREMKKTKEERVSLSNQMTENENTNVRLKSLLSELLNQGGIENVRPYSPSHLEILKIYEEGALSSTKDIPEDIIKISKAGQPGSNELLKYKLWLEQKYRSPYTGNPIPLAKLFTSDYEIEHVIPQSRYFDDSLSNKVICEAAVNRLKDNDLGFQFIKNHHGEKVDTGFGKDVRIMDIEEYQHFIQEHYSKNRSKKTKLLLEEIPEKMIERQLNDTRYISKFISTVLSNIVREEKDDDGVNSKNLLPGNGKITTKLRQDWGLNDVWNELIIQRFERMNEITNSSAFTSYSKQHQKLIPTVPIEFSKGFQKKRIDHRHHAMDALIIACATRDHINLLNNQESKSEVKRYDLQRKLRRFEQVNYVDSHTKRNITRDVPREFLKPWNTFTSDSKASFEKIVISFKQNLRIINKATNHYFKIIEKDGLKYKELVTQKGINWAIRKSMHKDTVSGKVQLKGLKVQKDKILTASRKPIDISFDLNTINAITDTGIQKILKNYLKSKNENPLIAFSPEGLEEMNLNIEKYNDGISHKPIFKVRIFEAGSKFQVGQTGNKMSKYVEADKGTNLFFAIYWDEKKSKRVFETIPLNEVIEHQKWRATLPKEKQLLTPNIPISVEKGKFLFSLSPNDLVYVPQENELFDINNYSISNIYKCVSFTGNDCFFIKHEVASTIVNKKEFSPLNKMEKSVDGTMIKSNCIKLLTNRLGDIVGTLGVN
ncbi:MAG: type II CRISPR RNA-guided endonuclease Cas9 [Bacteroidetes bacterium]|nr:type II CRISPR RNA-guided endonuclease Cas9 [Bacteroidota bacterium]